MLIAAERLQARQVCSSRNSGYLEMIYQDQKSNARVFSFEKRRGMVVVMSTCHVVSPLQTIRVGGMDRPRRPGPS